MEELTVLSADEFIIYIMHHLRQPTSGIEGMATLLLTLIEEMEEVDTTEQEMYIQTIIQEVQKIHQLRNDITAWLAHKT